MTVTISAPLHSPTPFNVPITVITDPLPAGCPGSSNSPPTARIQYTLSGGSPIPYNGENVVINPPATIILDAGTSTDSDGSISSYAFSRTTSGGVQANLTGSGSFFTLSVTGGEGTIQVTMTVTDNGGASASVIISFLVQDNNIVPEAKLEYALPGGGLNTYSRGTIEVNPPAEIALDASTSSDPDGSIAGHAFNLAPSSGVQAGLTGSGAIRTLSVTGGEGTIQVTMTVTDNGGASASVTISFLVQEALVLPEAAAVAIVQNIESSEVEEGILVTLDGSASQLADGTRPVTLTYSWIQTGGPAVNIVGFDQPVAEFRAPEVNSDETPLTFKLVLRNGTTSDEAEVVISIRISPIYFPQASFGGPVRAISTVSGQDVELMFRAVFILINNQVELAGLAHIRFIKADGTPMNVLLDGEVWNEDSSVSLEPNSSKQLTFSSPDPGIVVGWAVVTSNVRLTGLVLYQLYDGATGDVDSEVSLFSSPRGANFTTFFSMDDGLGMAVANPDLENDAGFVEVRLLGLDGKTKAADTIFLPAGGQISTFLDQSFFRSPIPGDFTTGTLLIQSQKAIVVTILKTPRGVAVSTLPVAVRR